MKIGNITSNNYAVTRNGQRQKMSNFQTENINFMGEKEKLLETLAAISLVTVPGVSPIQLKKAGEMAAKFANKLAENIGIKRFPPPPM